MRSVYTTGWIVLITSTLTALGLAYYTHSWMLDNQTDFYDSFFVFEYVCCWLSMLYCESKHRSHIQLGVRYCVVGHSNQHVTWFASLFDYAADARSM
jgi:hypothetical protein